MSELLSEHCRGVFIITMSTRTNLEADSDNLFMNVYIAISKIAKAVDDICINSVPGPDNTPAILLKKWKKLLAMPHQMWQKSLYTFDIPPAMKHVVIFLLSKGGGLISLQITELFLYHL